MQQRVLVAFAANLVAQHLIRRVDARKLGGRVVSVVALVGCSTARIWEDAVFVERPIKNKSGRLNASDALLLCIQN